MNEMDDFTSGQVPSSNRFSMKTVVGKVRLCIQTSVLDAAFSGPYKGQLKLYPVTTSYPTGSKYHIAPSTK